MTAQRQPGHPGPVMERGVSAVEAELEEVAGAQEHLLDAAVVRCVSARVHAIPGGGDALKRHSGTVQKQQAAGP